MTFERLFPFFISLITEVINIFLFPGNNQLLVGEVANVPWTKKQRHKWELILQGGYNDYILYHGEVNP